jgi:hypothetical protein
MRAALLVVLAGLAACGGDDGAAPPGPLDDLVVTAPDGFAELAPTETATIAWEVTASGGFGLELAVVSGDEPAVLVERRALASGSLGWDGDDPAGDRVPAGNYQVRAIALGPDDGTVQAVDGGATHLLVVQGVRFRDDALAFTGGQASRELALVTVTRSTLALTLVIDPDVAVPGDERALVTASVPGELAPTPRSYPFTGRDADDRAIAGGTYTLAAIVAARAGAITYRVDGPTLTWTP